MRIKQTGARGVVRNQSPQFVSMHFYLPSKSRINCLESYTKNQCSDTRAFINTCKSIKRLRAKLTTFKTTPEIEQNSIPYCPILMQTPCDKHPLSQLCSFPKINQSLNEH